jgi:hypothetical protein
VPNGIVDTTEFDRIKLAVAEVRDEFIESANDDAEKE